MQGTQVQNDNDFVTEDGISYDYKQQVIQNNKQVDQKQSFYNASNNVYKYLKQKGADLGQIYKKQEMLFQASHAVMIGTLSGMNITYTNVGNFGKVSIAVGQAAPIAGEALYQVLVSTESGEKRAMQIAGSLILSLLGKDLYVTKFFKNSWQDPQMLKTFGKTLADVEIVATILRAIEGMGYSKVTNALIDKYGGDLEQFIEKGKEYYEW